MTVRNENDFSKAQRGKFFRKDAALQLPIHLDPQVSDHLALRAKHEGIKAFYQIPG